MAQNSKKQQIADAAAQLFLSNGFKGTSVDMVVKASGVSKPTVYNHFPDKAALIGCVIELWLARQPSQISEHSLNNWLNEQNVGLLRLAIGEGFRFPDGKAMLFNYIEQTIRQPLLANAGPQAVLEFNNRLLAALMD